eukprot:3928014-Rhodomonas_salina.1
MDIVALIPTEVSPDDFVYNGDTCTIDFTICPHELEEGGELPEESPMQPETVEAVFVSYISPFAESRNAPLYVPAVKEKKTNGRVTQAAKPHKGQYIWNPKVYTLLYETSKPIGPHYDVVPLDR